MLPRRERRRNRGITPPPQSLPIRVLQFITSWEGIIGLSVFIVIVVLVQGILRLSLPFDLGKRPPIPDAWGYINVPRNQPMQIVMVTDASKGTTSEPTATLRGVKLALKDRDTVHDVSIELQVVQDTCDADAARAKATEIAANRQVVGVITEACLTSALAAKEVYEDVKLPYFNVSVSAPELTQPITLVTFRMQGNAKRQGLLGALFARQTLKASRVLLLHDGASGIQSIVEDFRGQFRAQAGQVADLRAIDPSGQGWDVLQKDSITLEPDLVYFAGSGKTAAALVAALKKGGYSGQFMVTDAAETAPEFLNAGDPVEGVYVTSVQTPRTEGYPFWKETYEKAVGPVQPYAPEAFDATKILVQAVDAAAKAKADGSLEVGRGLLAGSVRSQPYQGITGRADFDGNGDRASALVQVYKMENGGLKIVG